MSESQGQLGWKLIQCELTLGTGEIENITNKLLNFTYYEDLERINPTATAQISDLGAQDMPLTGGEAFKIILETDQSDDSGEKQYDFIVSKVNVVSKTDKGNIISLHLVKEDSKKISEFKTKKAYTGTGDKIIAKLFEDAGVEARVMSRDVPFNPQKMLGEGRTLAQMVRNVCMTSISNEGMKAQTCGYFFWGTKDGYHLASIDNLLSNGQEDNYQGAEAEYTYYQSVANSNVPAHLIIQSFENKTDGDLKTMADKGVFAAIIQITNTDTQEVKEVKWMLRDHWDSWAHIGTQSAFPDWALKWLDEYLQGKTSRTFEVTVSNEAQYDKDDPAVSTEDQSEERTDGATEYQDWGPMTKCQYNARRATMVMNVSNVVIPGNAKLRAGDKITLKLASSTPDAFRRADDEDKRRSGDYLIFRLAHRYSMVPRECFTAATLVKDSLNKNC